MKTGLGRTLIKNKFISKSRTSKNSVVEHSNLALLQMQHRNRDVGGTSSKDGGYSKSAELKHTIGSKMKLASNTNSKHMDMKECDAIFLNFSRCIPPRIPFNLVTGSHYRAYEQKMFSYWQSRQKPFPYERNLETWRQLWLTCERSDVIAQVLDARNPGFFFVVDLVEMYPEKKHVLLLNKSDLVSRDTEAPGYAGKSANDDRISGLSRHSDGSNACMALRTDGTRFIEEYEHVFYSSTNASTNLTTFLERFEGEKVAFVGYPNVGKSSTINAFLNGKRVQISQTPGKTKHLQSIMASDMTLIDCPGMVFPRHSKFDLILNGVLNVDKVVDYSMFFQRLVAHIGEDVLRKKYAIKSKVEMESIWDTSALDCGQLFKNIVKDYVAGNIQVLR